MAVNWARFVNYRRTSGYYVSVRPSGQIYSGIGSKDHGIGGVSRRSVLDAGRKPPLNEQDFET